MQHIFYHILEVLQINFDKFILIGLKLIEIIGVIYAGVLAKKILSLKYINKIVRNLNEDTAAILRSLVVYFIWGVVFILILNILGAKIESLITSLGLMSVAIGFAAQATLSNFISGLMIMFDRSIRIGDVIEVNGNLGTIHAIGILSTKLQTFDNLLIRIPNRELLDSDVKNYTFFDIRRFEIVIGISYSSDIQKAKDTINRTLKSMDIVLDDPAPFLMVKEFADSSIDISVRAWARKEDIFEAMDQVAQKIKEAFDAEGIEIPFPQVVVHMAKDKES